MPKLDDEIRLMDPRSEVVIRQQYALKGRILLINAPADALVNTLKQADIEATHWTWNYQDYQAHLNAQYTSTFSIEFPKQDIDQVLIYVPKSMALLDYILHQVVFFLHLL